MVKIYWWLDVTIALISRTTPWMTSLVMKGFVIYIPLHTLLNKMV
jgi:hypothetical protein